MIPVEVAPEALDALRAMTDPPQRCHKGAVKSAIAGAVRRLLDDDLGGGVRPWDLPALRRRATALGEVASARAVFVDGDALVAELSPGGERLLFRGTDDGWRLVRFADAGDYSLRPETTRRIELHGSGPESVLAGLGLTKPAGVDLEIVTEDLGQGETRTAYRYQWTERGRSILAEEVRSEIYDGATPYSTRLRGVIIEGDRGILLTSAGEDGLLVEG